MARLSKSKLHSFTIFEDTGIPATDAEVAVPDADDKAIVKCHKHGEVVSTAEEGTDATPDDLWPEPSTDDVDADDERRESADTRTSISSVAESVIRTNNDDVVPMHQPYTPPFIRPSFRRPQSVQRMQMTSPTPSRTISPRQSILSKPRSRAGTPRSFRSVNATGSPRSKRWTVRESSDGVRGSQKQDPLVLLHVVLLPIDMPWSEENMHSLLCQQTLDDLRLLQSRISANVLQRGVLIPHPGEEYELLEERLVEALGLQEARITACGHFIRPELNLAALNLSESETDVDSGRGSSLESIDDNICETCHCAIKFGAGMRKRQWEIKAFAANGLLRSAAWAAAWEEMERVDVEILPFVRDDVRMKLDERQKQEDLERKNRGIAEEAKIAVIVEERMALARKQMDASHPPASGMKEHEPLDLPTGQPIIRNPEQDLPQVYRPSQVPISILLKNYIYLLAQDRKNVVVFCFAALVALLVATNSSTATELTNSYALTDHCAVCPPASEFICSMPSDVVQLGDVEEQSTAVGLVQEPLGIGLDAGDAPGGEHLHR